MNPDRLNIACLCRTGTSALGPGTRYVIWAQGCVRNCEGCISPEFAALKPIHLLPISELVTDICNNPTITGVTISGGEPFLQASGFARLLQQVKATRPQLDVILFTGYIYEELDWPEAQELLKVVDLLVDGSYVISQKEERGLRGSTNQRFFYLSDRLKSYREELEEGARKRELVVSGKEDLLLVGIPRHGDEKVWKNIII